MDNQINHENSEQNKPIKLPVRDGGDTSILDANGKQIAFAVFAEMDAIVAALNEADALRAKCEAYEAMLAEAIYVELDQWAIYNNFPFGKQPGDGRIRLLKKYETNQSWDDRDFDTVLEAYAAIKDAETSGEGTE